MLNKATTYAACEIAVFQSHMCLKIGGCEGGVNLRAAVTTGGNTEGTGHAISNTSQADGDAPMYATNRVGPAFLYDFGPINR